MTRGRGALLALAVLFAWLPAVWSQRAGRDGRRAPSSEFHFIRTEYVDLYRTRGGFGRGWWMQDWPEADEHFTMGIRRLTRIDVGEPRHLPLLDDRIFDYPWIYATQTGYWNLSVAETNRLREYLLRGGFLVVDDFYGPQEWAVFREAMDRVFGEQPILELEMDHPMMHVLFDINERTQIPGLRHLGIGRGGRTFAQIPAGPPHWRAVHDPKGRMVVAINFQMDVGDAWEHADLPAYPAEMTGLAYRFGINYIIYSMTH